MNEALCSILSGENEWCFDEEGRTIKFNKDGTGELWCRCNFNYWIAADIQWKSISQPNPRVQIIETTNATTWKKSPQLLGQLSLEITLIDQLPRWVQNSNVAKSSIINKLGLTDDAFRPKSYVIRIERGNFKEPCRVGYASLPRERFALRLVFDTSPYPPRDEWKEPEAGPDDSQFWNHVEFVGRGSPELDRKGRAMNDFSSTGWDSCVVS